MKVAECKNITTAASELFISQPALSHQIQKIENELGVELFQRVYKGIELTDKGEMFYNYCHDLLDSYNHFRSKAYSLGSSYIGSLNIGYSKASEDLIAKSNLEFIAEHPEVSIKNFRQGYDNVLTKLMDESIDLVYIHGDELINASFDIKSILIRTSPNMVLTSADSALAKRKTLLLGDLAHMDFIMPDRHIHPAKVDNFLRACKDRNFKPNITKYYYLFADYRMELLTNPGTIAIVPYIDSVAREYSGKLVYIPIEDYPDDEIRLAFSSNSSNPLVPLYVKTAKKLFDLNPQVLPTSKVPS